MREIGAAAMADIARGAGILGAGGGGDPYLGSLMAKEAIRRHGPVRLVDVAEVAPDAVVALVGMLGAPTVGVEKIPSGFEAGHALAMLEDLIGEQITHVASIEAGGVNSTIPFLAAATTGRVLVDCDGMGRAFPEVQMMIPSLRGIANPQIVMTDDKGNAVVVRARDDIWSERFARAISIVMGCEATTAQFVMRGRQLQDAMVGGTLTLCERLGREVAAARADGRDAVRAAAGVLRGRVIFSGTVRDVVRSTMGGFARGHADIAGDEHGDRRLRLEFQNEHLVAMEDGKVLVSVPDLICVLESDTGEPITTEGLRFGQRVRVIGAPCDRRWRTPEGLERVGPRYFGYDFDYVAVEHIA